jgi:apolipoprotein N-acyltransferase
VERGEAVKVGLVQGNSPLLSRQDSLKTHLRLTRELKDQGVQLVVWSEAAITGLFPEKDLDKVLRRLFTSRLGVPTIVGTVLHQPIENAPAKGRRARLFNVALMADEKGNITSRYDKQVLLMFGEYLPFGEMFPKLYEWSPNSGGFTPGTSFAPLTLGSHRFSTTICYEDIIPSFVNQGLRQGDIDMLVNLTNDAWFGDTTEPWIHLAQAKLRSVEHRRYLLRATNSGVSAIIDPVGRVVAHSATFKEDTVVGTARYLRSWTLYGAIGNWPYWVVAAAMAVACVVRQPRREREPKRTAPPEPRAAA